METITKPAAKAPRYATLKACGAKTLCGPCAHADEREAIKATARADADIDRDEYGTPCLIVNLHDGFNSRGWTIEKSAQRITRDCLYDDTCLATFMRTHEIGGRCSNCSDTISDLACAWAIYTQTYEAAWAAGETK